MSVPHDAGLQARLIAAHLEVSHLTAIATDPATREELASIERLLNAQPPLNELTGDVINELEATLALARKRLHAVHNAIAAASTPRRSD